jgi:hypothetical protein
MFKTVSYVLLSLLLCPQAWAQSAGSLVGRVTDETGGVLPGVTVDFHSGGKELTAVTNETGDYRFENVPTGQAELTFKISTSVW